MDIKETESEKCVYEEAKVKYYRKILLNDVTKPRFSIYKIYDNGDLYMLIDDTKQWKKYHQDFFQNNF